VRGLGADRLHRWMKRLVPSSTDLVSKYERRRRLMRRVSGIGLAEFDDILLLSMVSSALSLFVDLLDSN